MSRLGFAIKEFIYYWNNPESKRNKLYKIFKESLRKVDGIEVPYYDIPYEFLNKRGLCQVIFPIKKSVVEYGFDGKEAGEKKIIKSYVLTSQLINDDALCISFKKNTDEELYSELKKWIRYFKKVHRRKSWEFLKEKIGIPVVVGIILGAPKVLEFLLKLLSKLLSK